jgi:uncharacterized membrane protein
MLKKKRKDYTILDDILLPKFHTKDILEIIIGATILAVPIGFTEETWQLGSNLPMLNIFLIMGLALFFIATFTYHNYHRLHKLSKSYKEFISRVLSTYILSFIVVTIILALIQQAPWATQPLLAFKRTVVVTLPASMSATIADVIK